MSDIHDHSACPRTNCSPPNMRSACWPAPSAPRPNGRIAREHAFAALVAAWEAAAGALGRRDRRSRSRRRRSGTRIAAALPAPAAQRRPVAEPRLLAQLGACRGALAAACLAALIYLGTLDAAGAAGRDHRGRRPSPFRRHRRRQARHHRRGAGSLRRRRHARAGTVADPAPTASRARSACCAPTAPSPSRCPPASPAQTEQQRRAGGVARAARRLAHRPADRPGDRHRQAHESVTAPRIRRRSRLRSSRCLRHGDVQTESNGVEP